MDIGTISLILLCGMLLLLAIGMPLGFASGFLAVVVLFLKFGPDLLLREFGTGPLNILAQRMYGLTTDYVLISVPLFIFMACLLERSGIAKDMYTSLNAWLSRTRGGIAIVTAIMAIVMAAMSGIIGGEVVLLGLIALPQMLRLGYNQNLAIGTICASGSLGTMIPPSIVLIIYGLITETSIHALFKAAFLPGFLLAGCYILYIIVRTRLHPEQAPLPEPTGDELPGLEKAFMFVGLLALSVGGLALVYISVQLLQVAADMAFPPSDPDEAASVVQWRMLAPYLLVPAVYLAVLGPRRITATWAMGKGLIAPLLVVGVVLGSIYGGIAAITEAAAMGTVAVMLLILFRGELTFGLFREALMRTFKSTGTIIWVTFGATALAGAYSIAGGPTYVANMIVGAELPTMGILLIMMLIFLFLGAFMDWVGIVLLVMPVFLPIVLKLPVDEIGLWGTLDPRQVSIWFGILFCVNMQVSFLSPPFGPAAFYLKSVAPPHITLPDIFRGFLPFIGLQLFILMVVLCFPLVTTVFL